MNDRMTELYAKACLDARDIHPTDVPAFIACMAEKLSELIVRECMDLALLEQKRYAEFTHRDMSECAVTMSNFRLLMKDHFGVEE